MVKARYTIEIKFLNGDYRTVLDDSPSVQDYITTIGHWAGLLLKEGTRIQSITSQAKFPTVTLLQVSVAAREGVSPIPGVD